MNRNTKHLARVSATIIAMMFFLARADQKAAAQYSAQAVVPLTSCQTITSSGSYLLMNDLTSSGTCFSIRASNVSFDGGGHTIMASGEAIEFADFGTGPFTNDSLTNVIAAGEVRIYGDNQTNITIRNITADGIVNCGGDDVTIDSNTVGAGGLSINNADNAAWHPYRNIITNNTVTGGSTSVKILFEVAGGSNHPCPRLDTDVENNTITDTRNDPPPEATAAVRIRCATNTTFKNNTVHSTGTTIGLYMRDESDNGLYSGNTFWTHDHEVLRIASGNVDKTLPANNTFINNVFRSDSAAIQYLQGIGGGNVFRNNLFWGMADGLSQVTGAFGNTWDHNTFYVVGNGPLTTLTYRDGPPADVWTNNIFDYSGTSLFGYDGWGSGRYSGNNNVFFNRAGSVSFGGQGASLTAWKTNTSADQNSIESDPLFVDPASGNFSLASTSPARGLASDGTNVGYNALVAVAPLSPAANTVPKVTIVNPRNLQVLNKRYLVVATATDADGIDQVKFYIDGKLFSTDRGAPYRAYLDTQTLRNGRHTLSVTATDRLGASTTAKRTFVASNRLAVTIGVGLITGKVHGITNLQLAKQYGGVTIRSATFFVDGRLIRKITTSPWKVTWDSHRVRNGRHVFRLEVIDRSGTKASSTVTLTVKN